MVEQLKTDAVKAQKYELAASRDRATATGGTGSGRGLLAKEIKEKPELVDEEKIAPRW